MPEFRRLTKAPSAFEIVPTTDDTDTSLFRVKDSSGNTLFEVNSAGGVTPGGRYDIRSYGALGNNIADDGLATHNAIAAANAAGGGTIIIPKGTWTWKSIPSIPANNNPLRIMGEGPGTIIKLTSTGKRAFDVAKVADRDEFRNLEIGNFSLDCNNVTGVDQHTLFGTLSGTGTGLSRVRFQNVYLHDIRSYNVPSDASMTTSHRYMVWIGVNHPAYAEGTQDYLKSIRLERLRAEGGNGGFFVGGIGPGPVSTATLNILCDDIQYHGLWHDSGLTGSNFTANNFFIGSEAKGGRYVLRDCYGKGSGDSGCEIDAPSICLLDNVQIDESFNTSFLLTNFGTPVDGASGQMVVYKACRAKQTSGAVGGGFTFTQLGTPTMGHIVLDDCSYFSQQVGIAAALRIGPATTIGSLTTRRFRLVEQGIDWTSGSAAPDTFSPIQFVGTAAEIRMRDTSVRMTGTRTGAGAVLHTTMMIRTGTFDIDIDGYTVDYQVTSMPTLSFRAFEFGLTATAGIKGSIRRFRIPTFTGGTLSRGVFLGASGTLAISPQLNIEDNDFTNLTANEVFFSGGLTDKVFLRRNRYITNPVPPSAITVTASPFTYQNLDGYAETVTVSGGTVSAIDIAPDGTTFTATGLTSGAFLIDNVTAIKVTYTVLPTMKKYPAK